MPDHQAVNEIKYKMAFCLLCQIRDEGHITSDEFNAVLNYVAEKYRPFLLSV